MAEQVAQQVVPQPPQDEVVREDFRPANPPVAVRDTSDDKVPAAYLLHEFLIKHNIELVPVVTEGSFPFVGDGFLIAEKKMVKIAVKYKG